MESAAPTEVTDDQFRLLCLLHLAEGAMRDCLAYFVKDKTITYRKKGSISTDSSNAGIALAQILDFIPKSNPNPKKTCLCLKEVENHFRRTSAKIFNAIFTPTTSSSAAKSPPQYAVNSTIDFQVFDISALHFFLTNMDFPFILTRKASYRRKDRSLRCNGAYHSKKCCLKCAHGKNCAPCSNCKTSHYRCYNGNTPCCVDCMTCDACATESSATCENRKLRHEINFLHNLRNLNVHSNMQTYNDLKAGSFCDKDFPACAGWTTLWNESSTHLLEVVNFLHHKNIIDLSTQFIRWDEITNRIPNQTKAELLNLYRNALLGLRDDLKRMLNLETSGMKQAFVRTNDSSETNSNLQKHLPSIFNVRFLLCTEANGSYKMVNDFLRLKSPLRKGDLSKRSELSNQLTHYIETILTGFLADCGSFMVILDSIEYDNCGETFKHDGFHISNINNASSIVVSCDFCLYVIGTDESLHSSKENGIACLLDQVRGLIETTEESGESFKNHQKLNFSEGNTVKDTQRNTQTKARHLESSLKRDIVDSSSVNDVDDDKKFIPLSSAVAELSRRSDCPDLHDMTAATSDRVLDNVPADQNYDYMFKLLIIGNSSVGKTSFLLRFSDDYFTPAFVPTVGIDFRVQTVFRNNERVALQIWDTAGQERYRSITTALYRGTMGFVLMYDITNEESYKAVADWAEQVKTHSRDNTPVVLVGNKCDMEDKRVVKYEHGQKLGESLEFPFFETSAKDNVNVRSAFDKLVDLIWEQMTDTTVDDKVTLDGIAKLEITGVSNNLNPRGGSCSC